MLDRCPRDLLLLLKMSDCLRNLDRSLGATHNQHVATADACCGALLLAADRPSPSAEGALEVGRQQNAAACVRAAEVIRRWGSAGLIFLSWWLGLLLLCFSLVVVVAL